MKRILIVEDQPTDLRVATEIVQTLGFDEVQARTTAAEGRHYLDGAIEGTKPMPDVILLDLDLGYESGYELLRFWYKNPDLAQVRMVVWTVLGKDEREMCRLFGVNDFVPKWEGAAGLKKILGTLAAGAS
jgi:CheY-like chemotaxis protein